MAKSNLQDPSTVKANRAAVTMKAGDLQNWWCPVCGQRAALAGEVVGFLLFTAGGKEVPVTAVMHRDCVDLLDTAGTVGAAWEILAQGTAVVDKDEREFCAVRARTALDGLARGAGG